MKGEEKRRQIRVFTSIPITFHMEKASGEMNGNMVDISLSGLRFTSREKLTIGDIVKMKFVLPNDLWCIFLGRIVTKVDSKDQNVYGVNFIKQDSVDRMNLSEYIMETKKEQEFWVRGKSEEGKK